MYRLIHDEPNELMTSFVFRETQQAHLCLWGNAYAHIIRDRSFRPIALDVHHPSDVEPYLAPYNGRKYLFYKVKGIEEPVLSVDMIHIPSLSFNGLIGKSPIQIAKENVGLGLALQKFGSEFFANGTAFNGFLKTEQNLKDEQYDRILNQWNKRWTGEGKRWKTPLLEGGVDYQTVGVPPEDAQWLTSRKFQLTEIARIFRVPPHMLADLERSTNNNIEHQGIEFVIHTIRPWVTKWEQEYNRKLFTTTDYIKYFTKLNMEALLRGDSAARTAMYQSGIVNGWMTRNEARELEDKNPLDGLDEPLVPLNMTTISSAPNNQNEGYEKEDDQSLFDACSL